MRKKKEEQVVAPAGGDARITPADIQQVEFRLAFRGYNERDVDAFLDRLTEDLSTYIEEAKGGRPLAPASVPAAGTGDAAAQAEEILANARAEADRIVSEAEAKAAAIAAGGAAPGDTRTAVAPFLNKEREFLQSLGTLVQTHAEEIKQMVLALRARAEAQEAAAASTPPVPKAEEPKAEEPKAAPAVAAASAEEAFAPITVPDDSAEDTVREDQELEDVAAKPSQVRRDSGERSLRELFWGED